MNQGKTTEYESKLDICSVCGEPHPRGELSEIYADSDDLVCEICKLLEEDIEHEEWYVTNMCKTKPETEILDF